MLGCTIIYIILIIEKTTGMSQLKKATLNEFLNITNERQLFKTLLLSLLYMFRALFAHHQELTETVRAAYSDGMR